MNPVLKKIIAIAVSLVLVALAVYGSYLPLRKSQAFIAALNNLSSVQSLPELTTLFSPALGIPSPIGQEEIARNITNTVMTYVDKNPTLAGELATYVRSYFDPVIARGKGMSFTQDLFLLGTLYELALARTQDVKYFAPMKEYYLEGLRRSPTRPQFLYRLFNIYQFEGNAEEARRIGEQIVRQWPEDATTREALEKLGEPSGTR